MRMRQDRPQLIQRLLEAGGDVDATFPSSCLHVSAALKDQQHQAAPAPTGAQAAPELPNEDYPLVHVAALAGLTETFHALLRAGAATSWRDRVGWTLLHACASGGSASNVASCLGRVAGGVDVCDLDSDTPLHVAAFAGRFEAAMVLLGESADPNAVDKDGCTPLHCACRAGAWKLVRHLLDSGADPNAADAKGGTPMAYAVVGHAEAVDSEGIPMLLQAGAPVSELTLVVAARQLSTRPSCERCIAVDGVLRQALQDAHERAERASANAASALLEEEEERPKVSRASRKKGRRAAQQAPPLAGAPPGGGAAAAPQGSAAAVEGPGGEADRPENVASAAAAAVSLAVVSAATPWRAARAAVARAVRRSVSRQRQRLAAGAEPAPAAGAAAAGGERPGAAPCAVSPAPTPPASARPAPPPLASPPPPRWADYSDSPDDEEDDASATLRAVAWLAQPATPPRERSPSGPADVLASADGAPAGAAPAAPPPPPRWQRKASVACRRANGELLDAGAGRHAETRRLKRLRQKQRRLVRAEDDETGAAQAAAEGHLRADAPEFQPACCSSCCEPEEADDVQTKRGWWLWCGDEAGAPRAGGAAASADNAAAARALVAQAVLRALARAGATGEAGVPPAAAAAAAAAPPAAAEAPPAGGGLVAVGECLIPVASSQALWLRPGAPDFCPGPWGWADPLEDEPPQGKDAWWLALESVGGALESGGAEPGRPLLQPPVGYPVEAAAYAVEAAPSGAATLEAAVCGYLEPLLWASGGLPGAVKADAADGPASAPRLDGDPPGPRARRVRIRHPRAEGRKASGADASGAHPPAPLAEESAEAVCWAGLETCMGLAAEDCARARRHARAPASGGKRVG